MPNASGHDVLPEVSRRSVVLGIIVNYDCRAIK